MATRRGAANAAMSMDEAEQSTTRPGKVAAFIPVDNKGNAVQMSADEEWRMPSGRDLESFNGHAEPDDEDDAAPQTPADRVISMLAEVEDDSRAYVKVSRVVQGKAAWCEDYSAATFEAGGYKMIRDMWGPGEYQVILYGTIPGTKRFTIRTRATVQIEAPLKGNEPVKAAPQSELASLIQQMAANQQEMMRVLSERPQVDPMAQMTQMLTMAKLMREAFAPEPAKTGGGLTEIVSAIKQLREVNEEINPPTAPDTPMGMVTKMLPLIQAGLASRQQAPAQQAPQLAQSTPRVTLPNPAQPAQPPEPTGTTDMNLVEIMKQKAHLATLVGMGKSKMPTAEAAQFVYDNLSDDLISALERDDWFEMLSGITGDIAAEKEWFTTVRSEALAMFEAPEPLTEEEMKAVSGGAGPITNPYG